MTSFRAPRRRISVASYVVVRANDWRTPKKAKQEVLSPMTSKDAMTAALDSRDRDSDRRHGGRGGRRRTDQGRPWWQKGLFFAALCAVLRCWRLFRPAEAQDEGQEGTLPRASRRQKPSF